MKSRQGVKEDLREVSKGEEGADIILRESKARCARPMDNTKGGADISDAATRTLLSHRMHPKLLTY